MYGVNDLNSARAAGIGGGTANAALAVAGTPSNSGNAEEFTADNALSTITVS